MLKGERPMLLYFPELLRSNFRFGRMRGRRAGFRRSRRAAALPGRSERFETIPIKRKEGF